ncbi:unnamed protein product [Adineta ricciae]|uniref:Nuclear receptor domain-containing protein n=1 Tax=Adineta ricciae TaxID=249248 RepID=A0A813XZQ4_ADIRI|nr:unnamed protein product [Adineta ricciae]CAF0872851.1 unnamed protein product [Adineta ricciae]
MSTNNSQYRKRVVRRQHNLFKNDTYDKDDSLTSPSNPQQQRHVRKKPEGLICSICEGPAHGYNFDAITCESCKAFFRRNALRSTDRFKCRGNDGKCAITTATRKRCKACRLAKCFEKGMRADWILTDEERVNKRRKIEENRRLRRLIYPDTADSDESSSVMIKSEAMISEDLHLSLPPCSISPEDSCKIEQINQAYEESIRLASLPPELPAYPYTARINAPWEMMNIPVNLQSLRLITFYKLIPEFSALNESDKLVLIKYNAFALVFVRSAIVYDPITDTYHEPGAGDCMFAGKDMIQCFSLEQYHQSTRCVRRLIDATQKDRVIVQIFLIIALLSKGAAIFIDMTEAEPIANDILSLFRTQNYFVDLLWKYCESTYGFEQAVQMWTKLVFASIDAHLQSFNTCYNYVRHDEVAEQLVPLMKSVALNV